MKYAIGILAALVVVVGLVAFAPRPGPSRPKWENGQLISMSYTDAKTKSKRATVLLNWSSGSEEIGDISEAGDTERVAYTLYLKLGGGQPPDKLPRKPSPMLVINQLGQRGWEVCGVFQYDVVANLETVIWQLKRRLP